MNHEAAQKIAKAKVQILLKHPFFAKAILGMEHIEDTTCETAYTDGRIVGYNPDFINKMTVKQATFVELHEALHPMMLHHTRKGNRNHFIWNMACDYAINWMIVEMADKDIEMPVEVLYDKQYANMTAEEIYNKIYDDAVKRGKDRSKSEGGTGTEGIGGVRNPSKQIGKGEGKDGNKGEGGCLTGASRELTDGEREAIEQEWKQTLAEAAQQAKQAGKLPANIEKVIESILEAKVNWKEELKVFATKQMPDDYTWKRPNNRFAHTGFILPSIGNTNATNDVCVVMDTSGSMWDDKILQEFTAEINGIREACRANITLIYADAAVSKVEEFEHNEIFKMQPKGGGGTDFRPAFNYIAERYDKQYCCVIYLTDLYGEFPKTDFHIPTIWCTNTKTTKAPFGKTLCIA